MTQSQTFELTFEAPAPTDSQAQVDVQAVFSCGGETTRVKGFYDGDGVYKVRFLPRRASTWHYEVTGVVTAAGDVECGESAANAHGLVRAEGTHFRYEDGNIYLPFGTTVYALAHQPDALVEQTLATLADAPFNKIRLCVFPKHYDFVRNEPPFFPFEKDKEGNWDVHLPCFRFWHRFEKILDRLESMEIQIDLILFHPYDRWGFASMNMEQNFVYLDTVIRRLAARPNIWWSLANEYDLVAARTAEDWYAIESFISENDPYDHLLSNHHGITRYDFGRPHVTHCCMQSAWVEETAALQKRYGKPVVFDEMCYEGNIVFNWGNISAFELTHRFWAVCTQGGYATHGETYMNNDSILWWASGGVLRGKSPARIRFLREILESLPGPLSPAPSTNIVSLLEADEDGLANLQKDAPFLAFMVERVRCLPPDEKDAFIRKETVFCGSCGEDVYLTYYGHTCPCEGTFCLPATGQYRIERMDVWNMTRETVQTNASGTTRVPLPGKEGMALLAVRI